MKIVGYDPFITLGPIHTEFGWHLIYVYEIQEDVDPDAGPPTGDEDADEDTLRLVAENYAHEFMMLGYTSKKVLSLFTSPHFKSANTVVHGFYYGRKFTAEGRGASTRKKR